MSKSTRTFYRTVVNCGWTRNLIDLLDDKKYPTKFRDAKKFCFTCRPQTETTIKSVRKFGRGTVVGWTTVGNNEIITHGGLRTHNSGKTLSGALWARMQFDANPDVDGAILFPTYKIGTQSTLPKFFEINPDLQKFFRKQEGVIDVPGRKGKVYVRSVENPNVIEGMTLGWAWGDEAGQWKYDAWINLQGRLSILQGKCLLTTTPYAFNWLFFDFYELFKKGDPDYKVVQYRSIDSPYFPKEEFERAKRTMDPRTFKRRYCGLFTKMEGLVYEDFDQSRMVVKELPKKFEVVLAGIDWGYTAPAGITVWGQYDGRFYLLEEFKRAGMVTRELAEKARNMADRWKINRFYADGAEPDRIREFKEHGFNVLEGEKDIIYGVDRFRALIKDDRIRTHESCKHFIEEIEGYHYPERRGDMDEGREKPEKVNDHLLDSTRYIFSTYQPDYIGKPGTPTDPRFDKMIKMKKRGAGGGIMRMA